MSNGSEHTPERCVHAVDGPDWAGLRELNNAEVDYKALVEVARARYKLASDEMDRLTAGNPGTNWRWSIPANPDRDSDLILSASAEDVPRLADAVEALRAERDALQVENEDLRAKLEMPCGSCHPCTEWANQTWINAGLRLPHVIDWEELKAERDVLQGRLDAMTVEWAVHWIPGDTYHDAPTEADAVSLAGEFVRSKAQAVQRLVGPWTVVPEGEQP